MIIWLDAVSNLTQTDTVQSYQSNLVVCVETIHVALMEDKFKKCSAAIYMHWFKFSGLKTATLVVIQRKESEFLKLNLT